MEWNCKLSSKILTLTVIKIIVCLWFVFLAIFPTIKRWPQLNRIGNAVVHLRVLSRFNPSPLPMVT